MKKFIEQCLESIENGATYSVNLYTRSLKLNGKYVIRDGKYDGTIEIENPDRDAILSDIEGCYQIYKHSVPSEDSKHKRRYFKALAEEELDNDDMLYGERRNVAQFRLEATVLMYAVSEKFEWGTEMEGRYFWQSQNDKDLVIFTKLLN